MSLSRAALEGLATDLGMGWFAPSIARLARTGAVLDLAESPGPSGSPLGASRLGGRPDLPPDLAWPDNFDAPLTFLGQIDLRSVPTRIDGRDLLPADGLLSFFYDVEEQPWGDADEHDGSRLVWVDPGAPRAPRPTPEDVTELPSFEISIREVLSIPEFESLELDQALAAAPGNGRDLDGDAYDELQKQVIESQGIGARGKWRSIHRLFGWADQIQGDLHPSNDLWTGHPHDDATCRHDWRLLLQLDSDDELGTMWGDVGRIYWSVDGAAGPEMRLWQPPVILQCA